MSKHRGLPYGWWKSGEFWTAFVIGTVFALLLAAWFLDWKVWW